jgi:glycosyltransferase involved in cell wall biosynthesis
MPYVAFIDSTGEMDREGWPAWTGGPRAFRWQKRHASRYYADALHVLTAGSLAKQSLVEGYGVPAERVTVVGGGTNFVGSLPELRPRASSCRVLFVGYEFERKGGDLLLAAFPAVRQAVPQAELVIVGCEVEGPLPDGVSVRGRIADRQVLSEIYDGSAVFCLPARYEPYGLVVQEAMAHALACIVSRTGALPDIVSDGATGLVIERGDVEAITDALISLLRDPERAAEMGRRGRQRAGEELTWSAVAERVARAITAAVTTA